LETTAPHGWQETILSIKAHVLLFKILTPRLFSMEQVSATPHETREDGRCRSKPPFKSPAARRFEPWFPCVLPGLTL